jgi:hypothetical protein
VDVKPCVVRNSSLVPTRFSSWAIILETAGCPTRNSSAAPVNDPVSTTRTDASMTASRFMHHSPLE